MIRPILAFSVAIIVVPVTLQMVSRYTDLIPPYIWTEEMARFLFIWMIMIGAMMPLSTAMYQSGAATMLGEGLVRIVGDAGPYALLAGLFLPPGPLVISFGYLLAWMTVQLFISPGTRTSAFVVRAPSNSSL